MRFAAKIVLAGLLTYALFPIGWTLVTSIKPESEIVAPQITYLPKQVTLDNYNILWNRSGFPRLMWNSVVVTSLTVLICIGLATFAGYGLSRQRFRGRSAVMVFFLSIRMFPFVMMLIPLYVILRNAHLLDSKLGLALSYATFALPLSIWLIKNFFDQLPGEIEDAARVDGCSRLQTLWHVSLPLTRAGIGATAILVAISAWNEFLFALLLTTASGSRTWPVGLQLMVGEFQLPYGQLTAGGVVTIAPVVVAYLLVGRTLVRGLMSGGLKA